VLGHRDRLALVRPVAVDDGSVNDSNSESRSTRRPTRSLDSTDARIATDAVCFGLAAR
jgi:hypothetical protein